MDGGLKVVIGVFNASATAKRDVTLVKEAIRSDIRDTGKTPSHAGQDRLSTSVGQGNADEKRYTGQKISLEFKDADIKNVFRLLAEVSGNNIMVTDDVNRKVTLRLIELPWDQAMDLIVETNGLAKDEVGNVIRISRLNDSSLGEMHWQRQKEREMTLSHYRQSITVSTMLK